MTVERIPAANRSAWLKLRERDVTASVAAALLGVHPFTTKFELWQTKAGKRSDAVDENELMRRGRIFEAGAVDWLRELQPTWAISHNAGPDLAYYRNDAWRLGCTPDVIADLPDSTTAIVQIKIPMVTTFVEKWLVEGSLSRPDSWVIEPPLHTVIQAAIEAHMVGAEKAFVAPLVWLDRGVQMPLVPVPVHAALFQKLVGEVAEFWKSIEEGREPEPNWKADAAILNELGRSDNGREIDLSGDNRLPVLLADRAEAKARIKADTEIVEKAEAEIIEKLGEFERAFVPGWKVARPTINRKGYEVKPTTYRQFKISALK